MTRCEFTGNQAVYSSGGMDIGGCRVACRDLRFSGNTAGDRGSALSLYLSTVAMSTITIADNTAPDTVPTCWLWAMEKAAMDSCIVVNNKGKCAFFVLNCDTVAIHASTISGNSFGIMVDTTEKKPAIPVDATDNWWGSPIGPFHAETNAGGLGDGVGNYVVFRPWKTNTGVNDATIGKSRAPAQVRRRQGMLLITLDDALYATHAAIVVSLYDLQGRLIAVWRPAPERSIRVRLSDAKTRYTISGGVYCVGVRIGNTGFYANNFRLMP